ncbi:MAG: biopolymer transporter ExbD [Opitutaceae bacterium]|jgi:biopolymer transport protein ExbD|nr:biopolymer transporter ExbD [Opitutaceae bacterium]
MLADIIIFPAFSTQHNSSHHTTMNPDDFCDVNKINAPVAPTSRKSRLNLTAMVSMLMFLLVTFVLFSMALARLGSVEAKLYGYGHGARGPMLIQVSGDGVVFINREPYDISDLPKKLKLYKEACVEAGHDASVLITGDDHARYGLLVRAIDHVKAAGIEQMVVETNYRATGK